MPINPDDDSDISNALNIARQNVGGADEIQARIGGLNQFLSGLDLEANTPQFNTGMNQPQVGGAGMPLKSDISNFINKNIKIDNPATSRGATDWLQNKIEDAEISMKRNDSRTASGKGLVGATTARANIDVPISMLQNLSGAYNEKRMSGVPGFDDLLKTVKKEGWNPDPISVAINHKGEPYIYEGNTRVAVAKALGIPSIPTTIHWMNGAENASGDWHIENFAKNMLSNPDITKAKGGRTGYATLGGVPLSEDEALEFNQNLVSGYDPMADAIQAKINSLTSNLNYEDVRHDPGLGGGKGLLPGLAANQSQQPVTRTGADILAKDPALAANPPIMSERGRPFHELEYTYVPKENLVPWKEITPEDLYRERALITPAVGDRSAANTLIQNIMGTELSKPVNTQGGGDFQRSEFAQSENPAAWASRDAAVKGMMTRIEKQNVPEDRPLYMSHTLMGLPASDSSHMMAQALLRQIEPNLGKITSESADLVDNFLGNKIKDWPGIRNPEAVEKLLQERNVGADTALLAKALDKAKVAAGGFPDVGAARFAITDPRLFSPEQLATGYSMSKIDLSKQPFQLEDGHPTYPTKIPSVSGYEGGLKYQVPAEIMFQDWAKGLPEKTKRGIPPSPTEKQQSLMTQMPVQEANQQWLDNLMRHMEEHKKVWGYNEGGHIGGDEAITHALRLARKHFDDGGGAEGGGDEGGGEGEGESNQTDRSEAAANADMAAAQVAAAPSGNQTDKSEAAANADMAASQSIADAQTQQVQQAQMGRNPDQGFTDLGAIIGPDASRMGFGLGVNTTPSADLGLTSTPSPQTISEYTQQRLDTPYQGTLQNAVMFPGDAFGMSYPGLVGKQNTAAGAAGFLGSLMGESGKTLDPSALNGPSIGIAQETGPRAAALKEALGIDPSLTGNALRDALAGTQLAQLGFALNEVNSGGYAPTARAMATGTNAANVADIVTQNFERPSEANLISSTPIREAYAQSIMSGKPSAATMPSGGYDVTPDSVLAALQSGVRMADTQRQNAPNQIASDAQLASNISNNTVTDFASLPAINASNAGAKLAPFGFAIPNGDTTEETQTADPYATLMSLPGYGSENPADIAIFNQAASQLLGKTTGPQSMMADLAAGQRTPQTNTFMGGLSGALENLFSPKFVGVNDPNYAKMIEQKDVPFTSGPQNDHNTLYVPPITGIAGPATSTASSVNYPAYVPPTYNYTQNQPYKSLGATAYNYGANPLTYQNAIDWSRIPGYGAASGGAISNNNALANSLRMLKDGNKA